MALLPGARDKTRTVLLTYEASSFLQAGEADRAAAAATQSLALAQKIGAPRCVTLVRELSPELKKFTGADGVDDLLERVRAT